MNASRWATRSMSRWPQRNRRSRMSSLSWPASARYALAALAEFLIVRHGWQRRTAALGSGIAQARASSFARRCPCLVVAVFRATANAQPQHSRRAKTAPPGAAAARSLGAGRRSVAHAAPRAPRWRTISRSRVRLLPGAPARPAVPSRALRNAGVVYCARPRTAPPRQLEPAVQRKSHGTGPGSRALARRAGRKCARVPRTPRARRAGGSRPAGPAHRRQCSWSMMRAARP
jgi:hypothetical protein